MAIAQKALLAISVLVVLVSIFGMATAILTSLNERRREMAVLRSVGARPWHVFALFVGESGAVMTLGAGILVGLIPAYRAYRYSLADGMTIRL